MYCSWPECRLPSYSRCSAAGTAQTGIRRSSFHSRVALGVPNQAFWYLTSLGVKRKNRSKHRCLKLALGERISLDCFVKHADKTYCKVWRFLLFNYFQFSKLTSKQHWFLAFGGTAAEVTLFKNKVLLNEHFALFPVHDQPKQKIAKRGHLCGHISSRNGRRPKKP